MLNSFQFYGALSSGAIYALVAFSIYLSFRVLDFPDLTVDGSYPLGAAVAAVPARRSRQWAPRPLWQSK